MSYRRFIPILSLMGLLGPFGQTALAQTNLETNAGILFNFAPPGASHLALGGAFLALADDATAAYTNPAGLVNILKPEVQFEARWSTFTHIFTDRGRLDGRAITGISPDDISGLKDGRATDDVAGATFFSVVYPFKRLSLAAYSHKLADFEADFRTQGAFLEETRSRSLLGIPGENDGRLASLDNFMKLDIENQGLALAVRANESLSFGIGLSYYNFKIDSRAERFIPGLFELPDFSPENVANVQTQIGDDSDLGYVLGFLIRNLFQKWSFGGVYRQGPSFEFDAKSEIGPGTILDFPESDRKAPFHVPDVYGLGLAHTPTDAIRITFDVLRVEYSDLTNGFVDIFGLGKFFDSADPELDQFKVDNVTEYHFGFEYSFIRRPRPLALRFGSWFDPDHTLRFEGKNTSFSAVFLDRDRKILNSMHFSIGVGFSRRNFLIDIAADYSERISTAAFSVARRF